MGKKKEEQERQEKIQQEIFRIKLPKDRQSFGIIEQRLGGSRMRVRCLDGKTRVCRIPGRLTRKLWPTRNARSARKLWRTSPPRRPVCGRTFGTS